MYKKLSCAISAIITVLLEYFFVCPLVSADPVAKEDKQTETVKEVVKETLKVNEELKKSQEAEKEKPGGDRDQAILQNNFGAGLYANIDSGNKKRVKSARVVGGVVHIEEESKAQLGFILEAHRYISDAPTGNTKKVHGPFVGIILNGENGLDSGIVGYMWGWRQRGSTQTMNIGLGLSISPRAQVLGDGVNEGQPLPSGETEVRYKKTTIYGYAITVSFGF